MKHMGQLIAFGVVEKVRERNGNIYGRNIYKITHEIEVANEIKCIFEAVENVAANNNKTNNNFLNNNMEIILTGRKRRAVRQMEHRQEAFVEQNAGKRKDISLQLHRKFCHD